MDLLRPHIGFLREFQKDGILRPYNFGITGGRESKQEIGFRLS